MTAFTKDDAEVIMRQLEKLLPEGVKAVLILAAPTGTPNTAALHCLANIPPVPAYTVLARILQRGITGEAQSEELRPTQ